ncbi:aminopeptidase [Carboxydothermus hydrogenoformans]|uniref:M18 family aminopeptidase n=1 Tax=Carboxydothermus hydrogenoformans (strain ATCC BAA-161 / DSM 6008 / Z-2901) TaxID=246194 RepID=Q3AG39_CARHZ|nr:aminopeptidase [Carboxydothermus hydrogenoformans]ABB14030.1 aminopeptidase, M18 family [Carboxydothermus hydrogenoformans Z-2901]
MDLMLKRENIFSNTKDQNPIYLFNREYLDFLSGCKTERKVASYIVEEAQKRGFTNLEEALKEERTLKPGDKVYLFFKNKAVLLAVIGEKPLREGFNLVASHLDVPRLDLKPQPLYEKDGFVLLKTHYYGGIKKYQWVTRPLALWGTVVLKGGKVLDIKYGEDENEGVLTITDLLPHLAKDQMEKKIREAITGEDLNALTGNIPDQEAKENKIKTYILKLLHDRFGITEEDLITAELSLVPAGPAREVGLDRSMVGGFGQDDRVCVFTSLKAILEVEAPVKTAIALFMDREEIGSMGNTGMQSKFLENAILKLLVAQGEKDELMLRLSLENARALSADVTAAVDPTFEGVLEKNNAAQINYGIVLTKYTGSGGKYGTSEASAEFMREIIDLFNQEGIRWQTGELGKVDQGGGGTVAQFLANLGMEVLDAGVALLSMHSPFEVAGKADIYEAYRAYKAFLSGGKS